MAKQFTHILTVEPKGTLFEFPIDMLRYDSCFPDSEADSARIVNTNYQKRNLDDKDLDKFKIKLIHVGDKQWKPTDGRWESFGYRVTSHEIRAY